MSRILFCWELGQNLGHILGFLPVALELRARGHDVTFVLRDLSRTEQAIGQYGFTCLQCPVWIPKQVGLPAPANYSEMLFRFGFLDPDGLTGQVKAWRSLFSLCDADLLVLDHAPTASLAARGLDIPVTLIGTGFMLPPETAPLPAFRWWQKTPIERLVKSEARTLATMNQVQRRTAMPDFHAVHELFSANTPYLCTIPELDHYPGRAHADYKGPRFASNVGEPPGWPDVDGKKVFAYLYPAHRHFEPVVSALSDLPVSALVYAPGIPAALQRKLASDRVVFSHGLVNLQAVSRDCDAVICHGGHGTVANMLLEACPILALPSQLEQSMIARRIEDAGVGLMAAANAQSPDFHQLLERLLNEETFSASAQQFSDLHGDFDQAQYITELSDHCETLAH